MINGEKFKHLSDENRMEIQNGLNTGCTSVPEHSL